MRDFWNCVSSEGFLMLSGFFLLVFTVGSIWVSYYYFEAQVKIKGMEQGYSQEVVFDTYQRQTTIWVKDGKKLEK